MGDSPGSLKLPGRVADEVHAETFRVSSRVFIGVKVGYSARTGRDPNGSVLEKSVYGCRETDEHRLAASYA